MSRILFDTLNLSEEMQRAISDMNYEKATEIQSGAIPLILEGRDVIGKSGTGTGKTAAFGIPAIERLKDNFDKNAQVLILCPTRELAMQISDEIKKYSKYTKNIKLATVFGGQSIDLQIRQLRTANLVIGTPGRIMDHMRRRTLVLSSLKMIILDEADEMLNMGFYEDIQTILSEVPEERQTLLFSATMPPEIMKITKEFQKNPAMIAIDKGQKTIPSITQYYYTVAQNDKLAALNLLIQMSGTKRCIVFSNTKKMVDDIVEYLNANAFRCEGIHGDMKQMSRSRVMNSFKAGKINVLVATDVAARGIDVEDIDGVFNFDIPNDTEYYIHRIGRTGRAGKTGTSYTLVTNNTQIRRIREIERYIGAKIEEQQLPSREDIVKKNQEKFLDRIRKNLVEENFIKSEFIMDTLLAEGYDTWHVANTLVAMIVGKDKRQIPIVKSLTKHIAPAANLSGNKIMLTANIGRNQQIAPNFIVGAIVEGSGISARAIGKIDIYKEYTNIEMTAANAAIVIASMQNSKIKGCPVTFKVNKGVAEKPRSTRPNTFSRSNNKRRDSK